MSKTYFGFALADSMFEGTVAIHRAELELKDVPVLLEKGVVSCLNPSHKATIEALTIRFGLSVEIPETPPRVSLKIGDSMVVMGVRGLPRLTDRHEYSAEEIASAKFTFSIYRVSEPCIDGETLVLSSKSS